MVIFSRAIKNKKVDQNMEFVHIAAAAKSNFFDYDDLIATFEKKVYMTVKYLYKKGKNGLN